MNKLYKIVAVILVLYSFIAGMLVPLNLGIPTVNSPKGEAGQPLSVEAFFYNTRFEQAATIEARLRINPEQAICASQVVIESANQLQINFDIPQGQLPIQDKMADGAKSPFPILEVYDPEQGYASRESAVFIAKGVGPVEETAFCSAQAYAAVDNISYPYLNILQETIRNLFFHVPMWFAMLLILFLSVFYSVLQLNNPQKLEYDIKANAFASVGVLFGLIGIATGALWARHTWGDYWSFDVKQNMTAIALLIYLAYFVLRSSFDDVDKRARIAAIYNIFAYATMIPLLYVVPRMVDSLHPGATGNPGFNTYDLDDTMRMIFYPAVIGWMMMGIWLAELKMRIEKLYYKRLEIM